VSDDIDAVKARVRERELRAILRAPWEVTEKGAYGGPRIIDRDGNPVCSFGNQYGSHPRGWEWAVARAIVDAVNTKYGGGSE